MIPTMAEPRITLEQWRALVAVVDAGGYAQAAEQLDKSQSAISYAIQKLETVLSLRVFALQGRKAVLTPAGELLYRRAHHLLAEADALERSADALAGRQEAQLRLAVEALYPMWLLLECLDQLGRQFPDTRIECTETVLTGTEEALLDGHADLAVMSRVPDGFIGIPLMRCRFLPVAAPQHPLHLIQRPLTLRDLQQHRQLVLRDSGSRRIDAGWLGSEQRWTLSHFATSIHAACQGFGFAWFPEEKIRHELASGQLQPLQLELGSERFADLHLVQAQEHPGPVAEALAQLLVERTAELCRQLAHPSSQSAPSVPSDTEQR